MNILGIDIGGSGIKAAVVDTLTGDLLTERFRVETPFEGKREDIRNAVVEVIAHFKWEGPVGFGFPAVVSDGCIMTASNIEKEWIGTKLTEYFGEKISNPMYVLNDADAAALAEMNFGVGKDKKGVILMITVGTGIGSALFCNNMLLPNLELGQVFLKNGIIAEKHVSAYIREIQGLSLEQWAVRFNKYLKLIESYVNPDIIIIGGGISRKFQKFSSFLKTRATLLPAQLENNAGIIGAAYYASVKNN